MLEVLIVKEGVVSGVVSFDAERLRRMTRVTPTTIVIHRQPSAARAKVEAYVEAGYTAAFDGRLKQHYPALMSVHDAEGAIHGAVGFRFADQEPLFLEHYLDDPVETAAGRSLGVAIARDGIVEIGSLASASQGVSLLLFLALAGHLHAETRTHAVATATRPLRRGFARAGFATHLLGKADASRLPDGGEAWGDYYRRDPVVLAGAIDAALPALGALLHGAPSRPASWIRAVAGHGSVQAAG